MNRRQILLATCISIFSFIAGCSEDSSDLRLEFIDSGRTVGSYQFEQIPELTEGRTRQSIREGMVPEAMLSFVPDDASLPTVKEFDLEFSDEGATFESPVIAPANGDGNYLLEVAWLFGDVTIGSAEYVLTYDSMENASGVVPGFEAELEDGKVPPTNPDTESHNDDMDLFSNLDELNSGTDPGAEGDPLPANVSLTQEVLANEFLVIIRQRTEDDSILTDWGVNKELSIFQQGAPETQLATWSAYHQEGSLMVTVEASAENSVDVEVTLDGSMMVLQETPMSDEENAIFDFAFPTADLGESFDIIIEVKNDAGTTIGVEGYEGILQNTGSNIPDIPVNKPVVLIDPIEVTECGELIVVATTPLNSGQTITGMLRATPMGTVTLTREDPVTEDESYVETVLASFPEYQSSGVNVYTFVYTATAVADASNTNASDPVQVTVLDSPEIESCGSM